MKERTYPNGLVLRCWDMSAEAKVRHEEGLIAAKIGVGVMRAESEMPDMPHDLILARVLHALIKGELYEKYS